MSRNGKDYVDKLNEKKRKEPVSYFNDIQYYGRHGTVSVKRFRFGQMHENISTHLKSIGYSTATNVHGTTYI